MDEFESKGGGDEGSMVQVVMIAESRQLQATLNTFGIQVRKKTLLLRVNHRLTKRSLQMNLRLIFNS